MDFVHVVQNVQKLNGMNIAKHRKIKLERINIIKFLKSRNDDK